MRIHRAEVVAVERLTPGMIRVTLGGEGLADFESTGVGDEYLRVFLPTPGEAEPVLPFATEDSWDYPEGVQASPMRTYTVRAVPAPGLVVIDFVVHDGGVAATWAQQAKPGDVVGLNSPRGLYDPPADLAWQILLADATGLPAVGRLIEQAPAGVRTRVVVEVPDAGHRQSFPVNPDVDIAWVYGGNGHGPCRLEEILRSIDLPDGVGYVWFAGETKVLRAVRKYLRHERGLPVTAYKTIGYWTAKAEEWEERWENLDPSVKAWIDSLWADEERDEEEITDAYFDKLESLGL